MDKMTLINVTQTVSAFLVGKGWQGHTCGSCGVTFFVKPSSKMDTTSCGWQKCDKEAYLFRTLMKRKKMLTPSQISQMMTDYFCSSGWGLSVPRNVANFDGQTDLVIAGVQMFDDIIHRNQPIRENKVFVAQPCVRMQFQAQVESHEGTSTSFVNVCTEKMGATLEEHLQTVDHWCTILSKIGLHMNDFIVIMRTSENDWGTGEFHSLELFFSYGGLELGDAAYLLIPQSNREPIPISDVGFGLERITWAVNKTDSYFDALTPLTLGGSKEMLDSCRTLALLVGCGVQSSNKGPGLQFRRFAKVLSEKYYSGDLYHIFAYYLNYWAQFIKSSISCDAALRLVRLEIERFVNLKICERLKLLPPRDETTEDYFFRLVYTCNIDSRKLRQAIQTCRT